MCVAQNFKSLCARYSSAVSFHHTSSVCVQHATAIPQCFVTKTSKQKKNPENTCFILRVLIFHANMKFSNCSFNSPEARNRLIGTETVGIQHGQVQRPNEWEQIQQRTMNVVGG